MEERATGANFARNGIVLVSVVAVLLGLLELPFASFMADDFIQLGILERVSPNTWTSPLDLYTISDGDPTHVAVMKNAGAFPWFFGPLFKMAFFRPLSSGLLALDHALFGLNPLGYRLHGVLWFLVLVVSLGWLFGRILPRRLAVLALGIFVVSGIHGNLVWLATRHIVIAAAIGTFGLACHVRWRQGGWPLGRIVSVAAFALAMTASEAAMGMVAYLFAYEAFGARGTSRDRIKAGLPVAVVVIGYLVLYGLLGLGASGGSGYINPLREPITFVADLPARLAVLMGALVVGGYADVWTFLPHLRAGIALVGALAVVMVIVLLRSVWASVSAGERRAGEWLLAGSVASAVPFTGTPIGSRCLVVPMVGAAVAIALLLHRWWTVFRKRPGAANRVLGFACAGLAVVHLGIAPLQRLTSPFLLRTMLFEHLVTAMKEAELDDKRLESRTVVLLTASDLVVGFHSYFYRRLYRLPMPAAWRVLSWAPYDHRFFRTASDTLEMELVRGEIQAPRFKTGDVVELQGMRAKVLEVDRDGPRRVEFRFDRPLEDPSVCLLAWREGRLQRVQPPPMGQSLFLPSEPYNPFR